MNKKEIPKIFLRFGIGIVFLTFGIWQLINTTSRLCSRICLRFRDFNFINNYIKWNI